RIHALPKQRVLAQLHTNELHGLANAEAARRVRRHGSNELSRKNGPSQSEIWLRQLKSPLIYILMLADVFALVQREWTDATVISVVIVANAVIGYLQERKAENVMAKLRQILSPTAKVIREGVEQKMAARLVVPGDIIVLEAGDRVPADARILQCQNLRVNQATLTGESLPAHKREATVAPATALIDRVNMLYSTTLVISGQASAVVTGTGMGSEIGKITREVAEVREKPENLERQINRVARVVLAVTTMFLLLLFVVGLAYQLPPVELLKVLLSLLVSIVPEGLPVAITVTLSVGLLRIFRKHAIIRKLSAAETLGSATVVCVDKTGTITEGKLMVEKIFTGGVEYDVTGEGYRLSGDFFRDRQPVSIKKERGAGLLLQLVSLVTSSTINREDLKRDHARELTDPTETALAVVAAKGGWFAFEQERDFPEVAELPFDQELRFSGSIRRLDKRERRIIKGAPESVLGRSTKVLNGGQERRLSAQTISLLEQRADGYASAGYRVVALAYGDVASGGQHSLKEMRNLTFVGFFAMTDPIRPDVTKTLELAHQAGVRIMMITGDHLKTAEAIARRAGIAKFGRIVHADELGRQSLDSVSVIARSTPSQKLEIVERLQRQGHIVAMTGDGVNDAPALKKADIGLAMGRAGTDVAIEASDMVLLQDSFSSIIEAIKQGRLIWENLRKVVFFLISTSFAEIAVILIAVVLKLPLPLLAVQILWMNLVTDGVNSMALTVEPEEKELMKQRPRDPKEPILTKAMLGRMALLTAVMTVGTVGLYYYFLPHGVEYARTGALTAMVFFQLFNLFNSRSEYRSVFEMPLFRNKLLIGTALVSVLLQVAAVYTPVLSGLLKTEPIGAAAFALTVAVASSIVLVDELRKYTAKSALRWAESVQGKVL
ncbi:MAG: HAD-IC family P-type ATPase, partial [Patescibacteria group bacterium]